MQCVIWDVGANDDRCKKTHLEQKNVELLEAISTAASPELESESECRSDGGGGDVAGVDE